MGEVRWGSRSELMVDEENCLKCMSMYKMKTLSFIMYLSKKKKNEVKVKRRAEVAKALQVGKNLKLISVTHTICHI